MHFLERTQIYDPKVPKTISYPKLTSRLQERKIEFQNSPSNCTEHEIVKKKMRMNTKNKGRMRFRFPLCLLLSSYY